jgi:hypothetical protein
MSRGFEIQLPLIARLRDENKIKVETLAASGQWFRDHYKITPATSVTVNEDMKGSNRKTVWFNSRFYRINLLWENGTLRFRDIHLFNENFPSVYTKNRATSNECSFFTLPFIDGYRWSSKEKIAGLRFKALADGKEILLEGGDPTVQDSIPGKLHISWPLKSFEGTLIMDIDERQIKMKLTGAKSINWFLDLSTASTAALPFTKINYPVTATAGSFSAPGDGNVFRITPAANIVILNLTGTNKTATADKK